MDGLPVDGICGPCSVADNSLGDGGRQMIETNEDVYSEKVMRVLYTKALLKAADRDRPEIMSEAIKLQFEKEKLIRKVVEVSAPLEQTIYEFLAGCMAGGKFTPQGIERVGRIADMARQLVAIEKEGITHERRN